MPGWVCARASKKGDAEVSELEVSLQRLSFELEATRAELQTRDSQLQASYQDQNELMMRLEQAQAELSEEYVGRIAAEKALDSLQAILEEKLMEMRSLEEEMSAMELEHTHALALHHQKVAQLEEDIQFASREAKLYLHREMEALAEVENQKETIEILKGENSKLRNQIVELQTMMTFDATGTGERNVPRKRDGKNDEARTLVRVPNAEIVADLSELEQALEDEARATKRRSYEIRAEAALLVETVEDRAVELVEKAQREVAVLKAELEKVRGPSDDEA
jgi:acetolactate synthase regulatory subunit/bisphosphoglycerate-dependent phosphoglycerate mutase